MHPIAAEGHLHGVTSGPFTSSDAKRRALAARDAVGLEPSGRGGVAAHRDRSSEDEEGGASPKPDRPTTAGITDTFCHTGNYAR